VGKPKKFEEALVELEEIVRKMECAELSLNDSLEAFEAGIGLARYCRQKLDEAERKVQILLQDEKGQLKPEPFEVDESDHGK